MANNSLTAEKKCKLYDWVRTKKDSAETFQVLAENATTELRFTVTKHNIDYAWNQINGVRKKKALDTSKELVGRIFDMQTQIDIANEKINRLTKRIEAQEGRML